MIAYSRYADDLTFSSDIRQSLIDMIPIIRNILYAEGMKLNKGKTRIYSGKSKMNITDVNINSGRLTVSSKIKREIRSGLYNFIVKNDKTTNINRRIGYIVFIRSIESDYYDKITKYRDKLVEIRKMGTI